METSQSHIAKKIEVARQSLPALRAQLEDQADLKEMDEAIEFYQSIFEPRQYLFCSELAAGNTKTGAMRNAKYTACSAKYANALLDAHQGGVQHCYSLMLKRRYMTDVVDKRYITSKLMHVIENAQEKDYLKVMIAALAELNKMAGNYQPIKISVEQPVSVSYSFLNIASQPVLKEVIADIAPLPELIEAMPLSECAIEFSQYKLPEFA